MVSTPGSTIDSGFRMTISPLPHGQPPTTTSPQLGGAVNVRASETPPKRKRARITTTEAKSAVSDTSASDIAPARHAPRNRPWIAGLANATRFVLKRTPLPVLHAAGGVVGRLLAATANSSRRHTRVNLSLCFPDATPERRRQIERRSLSHLARAAFELPRFWASDKSAIQNMVRKVHGQEYLDAGLASKHGLLLASAHVGSWEFLGLWFSTLHKTVGLYQRPRIKQFDEVTLAGRCRFGGRMLQASSVSLRALIRALRRNECVWMMADQVPTKGAGLWARFFGRPALTGTLLPRLVSHTGAAVVWAYAERLPRGQGFDIHFFPADADIRSPKIEQALGAMNQDAEQLVRRCPEQYLWRYRRFRRTSDGTPSPYQR